MRRSFALQLVSLLTLLVLPSLAQELAKRLYLKDGTYQLVTKYEVKGDRVRYMSAERDEWEEMPNSLVDWPATEKYAKDRAADSVPEAVQLDKELEEERKADEAKLPEVAPGLHLPQDSGVYLLDSFQGETQLDELQQTAGDVNRNTKANIFRGAIPAAGAKQTVEIEGAHASVQSHVGVPSIYISVEASPEDRVQTTIGESKKSGRAASRETAEPPQQPQQPEQPEQPIVPFDRFRIVKTEVKGNKRVVGAMKREPTGKISQDQHVAKTTITRLAGGWFKLTPAEPLAAGEYAVVEMMGQDGMNLYVWDFGVNAKAPANANPYKPDAKEPAPAQSDKPPELEKRP